MDLILYLDGPAILVEPDNIERQNLGSVQFFQDWSKKQQKLSVLSNDIYLYIFYIYIYMNSIYIVINTTIAFNLCIFDANLWFCSDPFKRNEQPPGDVAEPWCAISHRDP